MTDIILPPEQLRLALNLIQTHLPGVEVWAYGSRVGGTPRRYSDLDLVAFTEPGQSGPVSDLRESFEESDLPIRVDLFLWDELPDSFRRRIRQGYAVLQWAGGKPVDGGGVVVACAICRSLYFATLSFCHPECREGSSGVG